MSEPKTNQFRTSEIDLVTYLNLRGIQPERRSQEDGRGILHYERTAELEAALVDFMNKCPTCGIAYSEAGTATAEARRMLIDGRMPGGAKSDGRRGRR